MRQPLWKGQEEGEETVQGGAYKGRAGPDLFEVLTFCSSQIYLFIYFGGTGVPFLLLLFLK
jgi:hypothetical protein